MVNLDVVLVVIDDVGAEVRVVGEVSIQLWQGIQRLQVLGRIADARSWQLVARKGIADHRAIDGPRRRRVIDNIRQRGKVTIPERGRGHRQVGKRQRSALLRELHIREEEGLILHHRAANRGPVLVAAQNRSRRRIVIAGIQLVVLQELERRAMEGIGAGFRGRLHHRARRLSIFSRE